jgi:hypothetical protein
MSADFKVAGMSLVMVEWLQDEEKKRRREEKLRREAGHDVEAEANCFGHLILHRTHIDTG